MFKWILYLGLAVVFAVSGFFFFSVKEDNELPLQERISDRVVGFSHTRIEEGEIVFQLSGDSAIGLRDKIIVVEEPRIKRLFPESGHFIRLAGRQGRWEQETEKMKIEEGNGVVGLEEEIIIHHSDTMLYEPEKLLIVLEGNVKVQRGKNILYGDKITIHLTKEGEEVERIIIEGNVRGSIFF
jgi:hypothetical protein